MSSPSPINGAVPPADPAPADDHPTGPLAFPVVGVGASAGGLEAFIELLRGLPPDPGLALLFVLHLEPHRKSQLVEILSGATAMPVREAVEGMPVEVNHVYILPPGAHMAFAGDAVALTPRPVARGQNMPADHLFRSLAASQKSRAVAVILSGGGSDGTLAFQAIKAAGGITFAQDERSAKQGGMPRSAAADGNVDYVLPPREIALQLSRLSRHPYNRAAPAGLDPLHDAGDAVNEIIALLRAICGVDFTNYKRTTIRRRIQRRMALRGVEHVGDYLTLLRQDAAEAHHLFQDFLIRVTQFFRDPEAFEALKTKAFPRMLAGRPPDAPIRFWVAGCATGEEVYSLAIGLLEFLAGQPAAFPVKILATDLNDAALEKARAGVYIDNIEIDVSAERLRRFFVRLDGYYQVSKAVRDLCVFSRHNMAADPPFSRLDLISCRNVLIYMDAALQKRVLPFFHYALNPHGLLFLGSSESANGYPDLFDPVDPAHRLFAKRPGAAPTPLGFASFPAAEGHPALARAGDGGPPPWTALEVQKEADRIVLARYAPVGVVVDEAGTVVQFRGRTAAYLEPAPGMASLDLLRMLREGLLAEVRAALAQAKADNAPVVREGLRVAEGHAARPARLEVIPFKVPPSGLRFFLVLFEGRPAAEAAPAAEGRPAADPRVAQVQQELAGVREYLQSVVEEHESVNEELKSANEEILSANEELQSTNEELQTAKEEAQSANEELATVNDELHYRNADLARANNDLVNLLSGVNIPIVLVSRDLCVRRFTPPAEKLFHLIPSDIGRPIGDLKPDLEVPDLSERIAAVIDTLTPHEGEVRDKDGRAYCLRVRPYVTLENQIDGASIVLLEIDSLRKSLAGRPPSEPEA